MNIATSAPADPPVRVTRRDAVLHIELNRPEARNPLGADTVAALDAAVREADTDDAVRVLLFTATGDAFSAGGNLSNLQDRLGAPPGPDGRDPIAAGNRLYGDFLARLCASPKVSVAVVQGHAMGGGAGLTCACDIAVGVAGARYGFPEAGIGLVPGQILPFVAARIGVPAARRLMLTGERIDGAEAHRIGLIDYLAQDAAELAERTRTVLSWVLGCGPTASTETKRLLRQVAQAPAGPALVRYLDEAAGVFAHQMRTEAVEGVAASRARRKPQWAVPAPQLTH
jgi:isohexenylglutaconyl-CoA hydratase